MNNYLGQLNLTTQERRIVVCIFLVVIVVLNLLFVWPHFGEWGKINKDLDELRRKEQDYNRVIQQDRDPTNGWHKQVEKLSRAEGGGTIDRPLDPQTQLQQTIYQQERKTGVTVASFNPGSTKTNAYFEEDSTSITVESQEPQLISFLYNMGNDPAMIRVAKLSLSAADANRYRLKGSITLTANYAKKDAPAAASPPASAKPDFTKKQVAAASANKKPGAAPDPAQAAKHRSGVGAGQPPGRGQPSGKPNPLSKLVPPVKNPSGQ